MCTNFFFNFIQASYESFISLITSYEVPSPPGALPSSSFSSSDPATRRDSKIAAYRLEKTLKDVIKTSLGVETDTPIYAMLELLKRNSGSEDQPQSSAQGSIRKSSLALLQLLRLQTESSLSFIEQEMTLLKNASESAFIEEEDGDEDMRKEDKSIKEDVDMTWRLDKPLRPPGARGKPSELIDERGKVSVHFLRSTPCSKGFQISTGSLLVFFSSHFNHSQSYLQRVCKTSLNERDYKQMCLDRVIACLP